MKKCNNREEVGGGFLSSIIDGGLKVKRPRVVKIMDMWLRIWKERKKRKKEWDMQWEGTSLVTSGIDLGCNCYFIMDWEFGMTFDWHTRCTSGFLFFLLINKTLLGKF